MLKQVVGKGHPEFSTAKQQDALEYLLHILGVMQRVDRAGAARLGGGAPFASLFDFSLEERYEVDGMAAYKTATGQLTLSLEIPLDMARNKDELAAYEAESKRE